MSSNNNTPTFASTGNHITLASSRTFANDNNNKNHSPLAVSCPVASTELVKEFQTNGYISFFRFFSTQTVDALNHRLEWVLRGEYNTGRAPDKAPKLLKTPLISPSRTSSSFPRRRRPPSTATTSSTSSTTFSSTQQQQESQSADKEDGTTRNLPNDNDPETNTTTTYTNTTTTMTLMTSKKNALGYSGNKRSKVFQIINIHKCDSLFRELVTFPLLGELVAKLMKWEHGARLAQDQIWAKPPGAPPLAYHRDSPYFMFEPNPVATVWIALDDMLPELGPITYVKSSHKWGDGRVGSTQNFFQDKGGKSLLYSAARREGIEDVERLLEYESMAGMQAGGISIHDGRTWHGSGPNTSDLPRRGIGLHFVPVHVKWTNDAWKSQIWRKYLEEAMTLEEKTADSGKALPDVDGMEVSNQDFPITWMPLTNQG